MKHESYRFDAEALVESVEAVRDAVTRRKMIELRITKVREPQAKQ